MNIGIVTIYDGNNMGSFLQAIALKEVVERMGHKVYFVQRMTDDENYEMFVNRPFSRPRAFPLNYIASLKRFLVNRSEDNKKREEIKKIYSILKKDRGNLPVIKIDELDKIDLIICGSDEIWNFKNTSISVPFYTCCNFGQEIHKIAYAVSVGISDVQDFEQNKTVKDAIGKFDAIFVRDNHSKEVVDCITHSNNEIVCDPTLLIERGKLKLYDSNIDEKYFMIYAYELTKKEQDYIKKFADEMGLTIISVLHYSPIADKIITESPYAFASIVSNAEYCYTSTFHGTIFCTLFAKKFAYRARRPKVREVAQYLDVVDRDWRGESYSEFKNIMLADLDRVKVDDHLNSIRESNLKQFIDIIDSFDNKIMH